MFIFCFVFRKVVFEGYIDIRGIVKSCMNCMYFYLLCLFLLIIIFFIKCKIKGNKFTLFYEYLNIIVRIS